MCSFIPALSFLNLVVNTLCCHYSTKTRYTVTTAQDVATTDWFLRPETKM